MSFTCVCYLLGS